MLPISILCPQRKSGISEPLHDRLISSAADFSCRAREALMRTRSNTLAFSVPSTNRRGRAVRSCPMVFCSPSPLVRRVAQTANDVPPPYPSTANAPALGQPSTTAQVPPPPASPSYGGQPYGGQPYGGEPYRSTYASIVWRPAVPAAGSPSTASAPRAPAGHQPPKPRRARI